MGRISSASQMICAGCKKVVAISKHDFCKACRLVSAKKTSQKRKQADDEEITGVAKVRRGRKKKTPLEKLVDKLLREID